MNKPGALNSLVQAITLSNKRNVSDSNLPDHICSPEFKKFLYFLTQVENEKQKNDLSELNDNYMVWASCFEMLKVEFEKLWTFFKGIESETNGWYCVSPSLARWNALGHSRGGYNFSACIMKNFDRDAPNSEKSLTITYAFESFSDGMGDEMALGRQTEISEELVGLKNCNPTDVVKQLEDVKRLANLCTKTKLSFRLNHKNYGQESTKLDINVLRDHSLTDLAEKLFMALNNDIILNFNKVLPNKEQRLYIS